MIPTVGFNMRKITKGNVTIKLWDIGGQPRFRTMWERYCRGVNAIIYMVDAANQETIGPAKTELHNLLDKPQLQGKSFFNTSTFFNPIQTNFLTTLFNIGIPVLVLGNKRDLPNALDEKKLIEEL